MAVTARRDVFQAIADPTRREIIDMVASEPMNLNAIAANFDISRPAISQQIKILKECGLVQITRKGRERYCEAKLDPLVEVQNWVARYKQFWSGKLDALEDFLNNEEKETRST